MGTLFRGGMCLSFEGLFGIIGVAEVMPRNAQTSEASCHSTTAKQLEQQMNISPSCRQTAVGGAE